MNYFQQIQVSFMETWNSFVVHLPNYLGAILVIAFGIILAQSLFKLAKKGFGKSTTDVLMANFLSKLVRLIVILVFLIFALQIAGLGEIASGLFATAGVSAVIFGFAFRDIGENFISGVILSFNRPFEVNDTIRVDDIFGKVKSMEFRYTKIKTFDGRDVYIPNSDIIKKAVYNYTEDGYIRLEFTVGISYEENITETEKIILKAIRSTDEVIEDNSHETFATVDSLETNCVNIKAYFWVNTMEYRKQAHAIKSEVVSNVKDALEANGVSMPANVQELKLYHTQKNLPFYQVLSENE